MLGQRFGHPVGWAFLLVWCGVGVAAGAGIEVGTTGRAQGARPARPTIVPPIKSPDPVHRLLSRVQIGTACACGELRLYPLLLGDGATGLDVLTMDQAFARGELRIEETGVVGDLRVRNDGDRPVFLMGGEILRGGRQNRFPRQDVLLAAHSGWLTIAVYCGEEHRWSAEAGPGFASGKAISSFGLRRHGLAGRPQAEVWEEARRASRDLQAASPTGDFAQVYHAPAVIENLGRYHDTLIPRLPGRTVGLIAERHGMIVGLDLFGSSDLFDRLRTKVIDSYVLDALRPIGRDGAPAWRSIVGQSPEGFLQWLRAGRLTDAATPGIGRAVVLHASGGEARGLVYRDEVLHLAAFATGVEKVLEK